MENSNNDILDQYRAITSKLRKRYFRKPNVTEASRSFTQLAQQCEMNELLPYSGMCLIAAARCEGSLGNTPSEVNCLVGAARQFVKTESNEKALGYPNSDENLQAALSCYSYACSRCSENSPLPIGFNLEIADILKNFDKHENSEQYLKLAIGQASNSIDTKIHCLEKLALCYIQSGDYISALSVYSEIYGLLDGVTLTGVETDLMLNCELSRVFLLLILQPMPQRLAPSLAKLLEKYMWGNINDTSVKVAGMSEHLFILMQSLVMACQSLDTSVLPEIEADLWPFLSTELKDLLRKLIRQYNI